MGDPASAAIGAICKPIADDTYAQIKRHLNYLCCFTSNAQILTKEAARLKASQESLQMQVDVATGNDHSIDPRVTQWLRETDTIQAQMKDIENDIHHVQSCCAIIKPRYSLSKRARQTAEAMEELCNRNNFGDAISLPPPPAPPAAKVPLPLESIITLQSRKQIEDMIVEALVRPEVNIVGIGGIGGVGKTSMAEKIMNRMMIDKQVDEAVKVVVSQQVNVQEIQKTIADLVGLNLDEKKASDARAHELRIRLQKTKRMLIVLDDIWEQLNWRDIGIPCGSDSSGCKILLTSRDKQLLNQMGVLNQDCFAMETLTKEDAWSLFKYKAGRCVEHSFLKPIAEQVLDECKGLPLAILTVGGALKDQEQIEIWKDALDQLRSAAPMNIAGVLTHVYNPLRLSYDYLESEDAKSLFLLCCIFPEDFEISVMELARYGMGLNMFGRVDNLSQTQNRVFTVVEKLKSCSLLLDCKNEKYVKMHDVVRDVARFIAREKELIDEQLGLKGRSHGNCKWAFIQESVKDSNYKIGSDFQCLRLLIIRRLWGDYINIDGFQRVGGMQELEVLSLSHISLELIDCCSKNLKILELNFCLLKNLSFVGKLRGLEILKCNGCDDIVELPIEICNLERLKVLDLSNCRNLKRIRAGVISKLNELEELKMLNSFKEWESTKITNAEEVEQNASLKELESLEKLTCLEIKITNIELLKENISLPESIVKYEIWMGEYQFIRNDKAVSSYPCLVWKHNHCLRSWIHKFVSAAEELYLDRDWSSKCIPSDFLGSMVKTLKIENGKDLVSLVNSWRISTNLMEWGVFPVLERMKLNNLPDLRYLCDGPIQNGSISFAHLKELDLNNLPSVTQLLQDPNPNVTFNKLSHASICECNELHSLFLLEKTEDAVLELKRLVISKCKKMEQVFLIEKKEQVGKKRNLTLSKLEAMEIREMSSLTTFGKGIESIEFPSLTALSLLDCPKFKWIVDARNGCNHDEYSFHYFCNETGTPFGRLKELTIETNDIVRSLWCRQILPQFFRALETLIIKKCHNIRIFCSFLIAKNLINLKRLSIQKCYHMEFVIGVEKQTHHNSTKNSEILGEFSMNEKIEDDGTILPFPKLEILEICELDNFKALSEGTKTFDLHMLRSLIIAACPNFKKIDQYQTGGCNSDNNSLHLSCNKQGTFGMLKELTIKKYIIGRSLWCRQISPQFFQTLERLNIIRCDNIRIFCSILIAKNLIHLKQLSIEECDHMESLIGVEKETHHNSARCSEILGEFSISEENEDGGRIRPFPKLEILEFHFLNNFKTLSEGTRIFELHMLHSLTIVACPNFKDIDQNQTSGCNGDNDSLHLCCGKQLPYSSSPLKRLEIDGYYNVSKMLCHQISPCFFRSLEELQMRGFHKFKSAFPYSIAKHLLNLKILDIQKCNQMELVVSGLENEIHEQNSISFPSLAYLKLSYLPSLEMFCERECSLTLPSLEHIDVDWQRVYKKSTNKEGEDWNNLLHQHIMSKREEKKKRKSSSSIAAETSHHSSTTRLGPAANEKLHKDELNVNAVPSLSRQEFGSLTAFEGQPMPVLEQAESSTAAATMDEMTAEITCPNQLTTEQQGAQYNA